MSERLATMGRRLVEKQERRDADAKVAAKSEAAYDAEELAFWEAMDAAEQTTGTFDLGEPYGKVQFVKRSTVRSHVLDKDRLVESLRELHLDEGMVDPVALRKAPLNEYVRGLLKTGEAFPDGLDFRTTRYVTVTRKK